MPSSILGLLMLVAVAESLIGLIGNGVLVVWSFGECLRTFRASSYNLIVLGLAVPQQREATGPPSLPEVRLESVSACSLPWWVPGKPRAWLRQGKQQRSELQRDVPSGLRSGVLGARVRVGVLPP